MAGAGYKLFTTGSVLTAAEVNTYLQEQTVMVFADAAARTTALSGVVAEGMLSYLKDTDVIQYYNGSSWTTVNTDQTPLTTKGDLFTYSTADARLAVGNNGETLVADSSQTTGLRYNPPIASLANPIINGGFDIWARGTSASISASSSNVFSADRWSFSNGTNQATTISRQSTNDTTNLPNIQYCARVQRNSGQTGTGANYFATSLETATSIPFAGRAITLSFYARAGANYSPSGSVLSTNLYSGTGTDQNINVPGYTGTTTLGSTNNTLTTTWQRFVITASVPSNATELAFQFICNPTGTAGANDWYEVTGVQIDVGTWTASTAPTFRRSGGTLAGELAACQRYYWRSFDSTGTFYYYGTGIGLTTTTTQCLVQNPVTMRIQPTSIDYSGIQLVTGGTAFVTTSTVLANGGTVCNVLTVNHAGTGVQDKPYQLRSQTGYIGFSAEL